MKTGFRKLWRRSTSRFLLLGAALLLPLCLYFCQFHGALSKDTGRWSDFGSYLSGTYGTLALFLLVQSSVTTAKQFRRLREDEMFFRLAETFQNYIAGSRYEQNGNEWTSHRHLRKIADDFSAVFRDLLTGFGESRFVDSAGDVWDNQYDRLFRALKGETYHKTFDADKAEFIEKMSVAGADKIRLRKKYFGYEDEYSSELKEAFRMAGLADFYAVTFADRQAEYQTALSRIKNVHGDFIEGYINLVSIIVEHIRDAHLAESYVRYFLSVVGTAEVAILYYIAAGSEKVPIGVTYLHEIGLFQRLLGRYYDGTLVASPSDEQIERELADIFRR